MGTFTKSGSAEYFVRSAKTILHASAHVCAVAGLCSPSAARSKFSTMFSNSRTCVPPDGGGAVMTV